MIETRMIRSNLDKSNPSKVSGYAIRFNTLPCPMEVDYLMRFIQGQTVSFDWIIIDTLRTALLTDCEKGTENDAAIGKYVQTFRTLGKKEGKTITFVHHNNRTHNTMAGSAFLQGLSDSLWNCNREDKSNIVEVKAQNRRMGYEEFAVLRQPDGKLVKNGVAGPSKLGQFIDFFGSAPGLTIKEVLAKNQMWFDVMGITEKTAKNWLADAQKAGLVRNPEDTAVNVSPRYFKSCVPCPAPI